MGGARWQVVGGGDKGGIVVREGRDLDSAQLPRRLSTGAVVAELELVDERLHYLLLSGDGPDSGWVSLKVKSQSLVRPALEPAVEVPLGDQKFYAGLTPLPCLEELSVNGLTLWRPWRFPLADLELLREELIGMLMLPSCVRLRFFSDATSLLLTFYHLDPRVLHGRRFGDKNSTVSGKPGPIGGENVSTLMQFDTLVNGEFWARRDNSPIVRGMDPNSLAPHLAELAPRPIRDPIGVFMHAFSAPEVSARSKQVQKVGDSHPFDRRMGVAFRGLPAGEKLLEVYLPHDSPILLESLQLSSGMTFRAAPEDRPVWVTYGSSITHGMPFANGPASIWPAVAGRLAGVCVQSLGVAGQCLGDQTIAQLIKKQRGIACISVKFGINVHNLSAMGAMTFSDVLLGFLLTVREGHPNTPLAVLSPVHGCWREDENFYTAPSLRSMRADIEMVVKALQRRGDENLHYIDGSELLGPADVDMLPDELHPSGDAHELMGHRFARLAFGKAGVLLPGRVDDDELEKFEPPMKPKMSG